MPDERLVEILGFDPDTSSESENLRGMRPVSEKLDIQPKFSLADLAKARREGNYQLETIVEDEENLFLVEREFGHSVIRSYLERFWKPGLPFRFVAEARFNLREADPFSRGPEGEGYYPWFLKFSTTQNEDSIELRPWGNQLDCNLYFDQRLGSIRYDNNGKLQSISINSHESLYDDRFTYRLALWDEEINKLTESGETKEYRRIEDKIKRKNPLEALLPHVDFTSEIRDEYQASVQGNILVIQRTRDGVVKDTLRIVLEIHGEKVMDRLLGQTLIDDPLNPSLAADDSWRDLTPEQILPIVGILKWERF